MANATLKEPVFLLSVQWNWALITQLMLAIIGIIGNSTVIHVYRRSRKTFKSATNKFIAALAVADLITSICLIPYPKLSSVPDTIAGHIYCKVVHSSNIMWVSIVASIFTLTALSVERYIAVRLPTRYRSLLTLKTTRITIVLIWIGSFVINTFSYYVTHLHHGQCLIEFPTTEFQIFLGVSVFVVEYLLPIVIMLVANILAIRILREQGRSLSAGQEGTLHKSLPKLTLLRASRRVIIMLTVVIISFIICWSPDKFAFLAFNLGLVPFQYLYGSFYQFFVILAFANSCVNPIIYLCVNKNFREAIRQGLPSLLRSSTQVKNHQAF